MKKLLILGGSHRDIPLIMAARRQGFFVITLGNRPYYVGHDVADSFYKVDFTDKASVFEIIDREKVDFIMPGCSDKAVEMALLINNGGFVCSPEDIKKILSFINDKWNFKKMCEELDIPVPRGIVVNADTVGKDYDVDLKFPCIVKPLTLSGGRGVSIVRYKQQLDCAVRKAAEAAGDNRVLIEEFLEGDLMAYSAVISNGRIIFDFLARDRMFLNKFMVTTSHPEIVPDEVQRRLRDYVSKIVDFLRIKSGPFHVQFIMKDEDEIFLIDPALRIPGDLFPYLIEFSTGYPYSKAIVSLFTGKKLNEDSLTFNIPVSPFVIRHCIMPGKNGVYKGVAFDDFVKKKIFYFLPIMGLYDNITNYMRQQIAIAFIRCDSYRQMQEIAESVNDLITPRVY